MSKAPATYLRCTLFGNDACDHVVVACGKIGDTSLYVIEDSPPWKRAYDLSWLDKHHPDHKPVRRVAVSTGKCHYVVSENEL